MAVVGAGRGPQRGHDLPLPDRRLQRGRRRGGRRPHVPHGLRTGAPGHHVDGRARGRAHERLAAQPHRPQPRRHDLPLRVRALVLLRLAHAGARDRRRRHRRRRRGGDRRPAAVPPLPLPRRGDQRGRAARERQPHVHDEPRADRDHALARGAAHQLGRRDRGLRAASAAAASTGSRSRSSARTSRSPARSPRSARRRRCARTATGRFRFYVPTLFSATRLHALTRTTVQAVSAPVTANVAVRVGARLRRGTRRAVRDPRLGRAGRAERARDAAAPDAPRPLGVRARDGPAGLRVQPLPLRLQGPQAARCADLPRARDRARRRRARARHEPHRRVGALKRR